MLENLLNGSSTLKVIKLWNLASSMERVTQLLQAINMVFPSHIKCLSKKFAEKLVNVRLDKDGPPIDLQWIN